MTKEITGSEDIIDSRDVIARIADLQFDRDQLESDIEDWQQDVEAAKRAVEAAEHRPITSDAIEAAQEHLNTVEVGLQDARDELSSWDEDDDGQELKRLKAFAEEGESSFADWSFGVGLVRDGYFEDYARDFAEDIGAIQSDSSWPNGCIDWKRAAKELQMDYTSIEFNGETYWGR